MSGVERVRIDTERHFLDIVDKVHEIHHENIDTTHIFTLSQVYEGLLLKMGEIPRSAGRKVKRRRLGFPTRLVRPKYCSCSMSLPV